MAESILKKNALSLEKASGWRIRLGAFSRQQHTCGVYYKPSNKTWYYYTNTSWCRLNIAYGTEEEAYDKLIKFLEYEARKHKASKVYERLGV